MVMVALAHADLPFRLAWTESVVLPAALAAVKVVEPPKLGLTEPNGLERAQV